VFKRPHPVLRELGQRIKAIREENKVSQEQLALRAGLDRSFVSGLENGRRNVSILSLLKITTALRVSLTTLFEPR
jgi:transcriptional regulator with XRE-family HTH domain